VTYVVSDQLLLELNDLFAAIIVTYRTRKESQTPFTKINTSTRVKMSFTPGE